MERNERVILRIRCSKTLFRQFKKISIDFDDYESALQALLILYDKYSDMVPQLQDSKKQLGKYVLTH